MVPKRRALLLPRRYRQKRGLERARAITSVVRVVKQQDAETVARLLNAMFTFQDSAEMIRQLYVGESRVVVCACGGSIAVGASLG